MNKGFSSTLKKLRKGKRLTLEQLANDINQKYDVNFNKGMLSKWENNQLPKLKNAKILASYFNVTLNQLLDFNLDVENKGKIPVFKSYQTGAAIYLGENVLEYAYPPLELVGQLKDLFYLQVTGDFMDREYPNKSIVLIDKGASIQNGDNVIAVIGANDEGILTKISFQDNFITVIPSSKNPNHLPKVIDTKQESIQIIGKVISSFKIYA